MKKIGFLVFLSHVLLDYMRKTQVILRYKVTMMGP
jgi:hypothetical protein